MSLGYFDLKESHLLSLRKYFFFQISRTLLEDIEETSNAGAYFSISVLFFNEALFIKPTPDLVVPFIVKELTFWNIWKML